MYSLVVLMHGLHVNILRDISRYNGLSAVLINTLGTLGSVVCLFDLILYVPSTIFQL